MYLGTSIGGSVGQGLGALTRKKVFLASKESGRRPILQEGRQLLGSISNITNSCTRLIYLAEIFEFHNIQSVSEAGKSLECITCVF